MRALYIDKDFKCHTQVGNGLTKIETDIFNGKCDAFIEGYRYIPEGSKWTRSDGAVIHGMSISPLVDYKELDSSQRENERAALEHVGLTGQEAPVEQAIEMRGAIDMIISEIGDEAAVNTPVLFPVWDANGIRYKKGDRVRRDSELYRCLQEHTSQNVWTPETAVSLWVKIADPAEEWPDWIQPLGSHDAYSKGAKVTYKGARYISTADGNVWPPGTYGWEVTVS